MYSTNYDIMLCLYNHLVYYSDSIHSTQLVLRRTAPHCRRCSAGCATRAGAPSRPRAEWTPARRPSAAGSSGDQKPAHRGFGATGGARVPRCPRPRYPARAPRWTPVLVSLPDAQAPARVRVGRGGRGEAATTAAATAVLMADPTAVPSLIPMAAVAERWWLAPGDGYRRRA